MPPLITLTVISYFYDAFAHNYYVQILLRGMQCGATALILDVGINLLQKELKKKLLLPMHFHHPKQHPLPSNPGIR